VAASQTSVAILVTVAVRQWSARGGPIVLGRVVPGIVACIGLLAVVGAVATLERYGWRDASGPVVLFVAVGLGATWLLWRFLRTAWLVVLADDTFTCLATSGRWTFGPGEIVAVRGDVYQQVLQFVGLHAKVSVWAQIVDREALFSAIRRANPHVEFAPWIQTSGE
jgi:hypothetical protein